MTHKRIKSHFDEIQEHFTNGGTIQEYLHNRSDDELGELLTKTLEDIHIMGIVRDFYYDQLKLPPKKFLPISAIFEFVICERQRRNFENFSYSIHYNNEDVKVKTTNEEKRCLTVAAEEV